MVILKKSMDILRRAGYFPVAVVAVCGVIMESTELALRPTYWANVSGGKDSLFMLNLILHNLDKYPLDGVVHFELEIDYPFIKNVIDYMQSECKRFGIRLLK